MTKIMKLFDKTKSIFYLADQDKKSPNIFFVKIFSRAKETKSFECWAFW